MNTHGYAAYSLIQVIEAIIRMRYEEVERSDFPNRPGSPGSQPVIFSLPGNDVKYLFHFREIETKYYRNGSLGIILSHRYDSESPDDIEGSVIEVKLYKLDETKKEVSKEFVCMQLYSTSKGCDERSLVSFGGRHIMARAQSLQTIEFIDGFCNIAPLPPNS